jgi:hypothetical protein
MISMSTDAYGKSIYLLHRFQYLILGLLIGCLLDSMLATNEAAATIVGGLVAFLVGFLLVRRRNER